jgi:hypothetical protein
VPAKAGSLFNLREDLGETKDVSGEHPEQIARLEERMNAFMSSFRENIRPRERVSTP